jgi:endonuclease/exonuclease/phosphatase family metal-dependent hydrolase
VKQVFFLLSIVIATTLNAQDLHVMTFNIRYDTPADSLNAWPHRRDNAATQVLFHDIQLLGVQEALHGQLEDLAARLPRFRYLGVGRDDGKQKGEYSAIFYDTTRLQPLQSATFWLSLTPEVPGSKSWDAAITRIVTWLSLKTVVMGEYFMPSTRILIILEKKPGAGVLPCFCKKWRPLLAKHGNCYR